MSITSEYSRAREGFHQRLREYIVRKHGSINAFCKAVGIKYPAQMTPYLKGKCFPGKKMIARLEKDGADIDWLLSGNMASPRTTLANSLFFSRYRMDIENLLRQVRLHIARHSELYQTAIEAYAVMDDTERIVELTGSIERFLAYDKDALHEARLDTILHPSDYAEVSNVLKADHGPDDIVTFTSKFRTGDGSYMDVEWSVFIKNKPMSDRNEYAIVLKKAGS